MNDARAGTRPDYAVVVPVRGVVTGVAMLAGILGAVIVIERGSAALFLLSMSLVACMCLQPLCRGLQRVIGRGAIAVSAVLGIVVSTAALAGLAWELERQLDAIREAVRRAAESLPADGNAADVVERLQLTERVDTALDGLGTRIVVGADDPIAAAGVFGRIVVVFVLAGFMLAGGAALLKSMVGVTRRTSTRERIHAGIRAIDERAAPFFRRTLLVSLAHGAVAALWCWSMGLPGAIALGAWMTVASTVPILGAPVGWALIAALSYARHDSVLLVVAAAIVAMAADRWVRRHYVDRAFRTGPLLTLFGLTAGAYIAGPAGAFVGLFVVAAIAAFLAAQDSHAPDAVVDLVEGAEEPLELEPVASDLEGDERVVRLRLSTRTAAVTAVLAIGAWATFRLGQRMAPLIIWLAITTLISFGLDRPITWLTNRLHLPRWTAVSGVLGLSAVGLVALAVFAGPAITDSIGSIVEDAPKTVESLESLPLIGDALRERDASTEVEQWLAELPDRLGESDAVSRIAQAAGDGLLGAALIISFVVAALLDAPRLVRAADRRVPVRHRRDAQRVGRAAYRTISRVAAASAFVATLNGTVVMTLAFVFGIPLAVVLGVWAAGWNFVPQIGGFVGAAPLVALGFGQSPTTGIITLVTFVAYQTFENHVIQPVLGSRAVGLPPLVVMIGVLLGGALAGFVGALFAGSILGVVKAVSNEIGSGPEERVEDRSEVQSGVIRPA